MTTIKQVAVSTPAHAANMGKYLNDDRALLRSSQHIADEDRWEQEMAATRAAYGHDKASRAGAQSALMFHQVLAFNPDEADMNGGKMTPGKCMEYARQWIEARYPNQEAVYVLHRERCRADQTERYAVHAAINRTDLTTGNRLNEGRSKNAKIERANAIRDMDARWGLRQVRANERNSRVHARQPTRAEQEMAARGIRSDKQYLRDAITSSMRVASAHDAGNKIRDLSKSLEEKGVGMTVSKNGKDFTFERKSTGTKVNGVKLGRGFSMQGIASGLGMDAARGLARAAEQGMDS